MRWVTTGRISCSGWNEIYGQSRALGFLRRSIECGEMPHAALLSGPRGVGKYTSSLLLAAALLCPSQEPDGCASCTKVARGVHPDLHIVEAEGNVIAVDQVRGLEKELNRKPHEAACKVAVIDDADQMNRESANSFLKTLEEPPDGTYIILVSSAREKLLPTILSRCRETVFSPLGKKDIQDFLTGSEGLDTAEAERLARKSGGIFGRALLWARNPEVEKSWDRGVEIAASLRRSSLLGLLEQAEAAREMLSVKSAAGTEDRQDLEAYLKAMDERSTQRLRKRLEEKEKRELARLRRQAAIDLFDGMRSFYRDIMLLNLGEEAGKDSSEIPLMNAEWREELEREALHIGSAESMRRLQILQNTQKALEANVDVGLLLDSLLLELK